MKYLVTSLLLAPMKHILFCVGFIILAILSSLAGDGVDGPNRYEADFGRSLTQHEMSQADYRWSTSLLKNLNELGKAVYFTRTDLPIIKDGKEIVGAVYRRIDQTQYFYISDGDAMIDIKNHLIYSPGVGGFSMHSPPSHNFIVCLNFQKGGVPFTRHSEIGLSKTWWFSSQECQRLEKW